MKILHLGAGPSSDAEFQIDIVKFPKTTHVLDIATNDLPFEDDFFDLVVAEQVLEHIPVVIYYGASELKDLKHHYARVHVMRQIYRVLKPGGILKASVPNKWPFWVQDPTHCDTPWTRDTFEYYVGGYGGNVKGDFAKEAYGIDFAFKKVRSWQGSNDFFNFYIELKKP